MEDDGGCSDAGGAAGEIGISAGKMKKPVDWVITVGIVRVRIDGTSAKSFAIRHQTLAEGSRSCGRWTKSGRGEWDRGDGKVGV